MLLISCTVAMFKGLLLWGGANCMGIYSLIVALNPSNNYVNQTCMIGQPRRWQAFDSAIHPTTYGRRKPLVLNDHYHASAGHAGM